ncbi:MAG: SagB/ThcOx family dehydrogenase, partial [Candidatus Atribacteria bacterium]|nr:SagB/ThcOx family dehydrogenase [Candidatus Atribacteria bacterium]MCD6350294.1 SagB/ThcOx family dehydrogenase [Candidatus Atribacteria bacterium]
MIRSAWGGERFALPQPRGNGKYSLEEVLIKRRSVRSFAKQALALEEFSQLLFAAQGITDERRGFRAVPSAGALYPLEIYVVVGKIEGLLEGIYRYLPRGHELERVLPEDR